MAGLYWEWKLGSGFNCLVNTMIRHKIRGKFIDDLTPFVLLALVLTDTGGPSPWFRDYKRPPGTLGNSRRRNSSCTSIGIWGRGDAYARMGATASVWPIAVAAHHAVLSTFWWHHHHHYHHHRNNRAAQQSFRDNIRHTEIVR